IELSNDTVDFGGVDLQAAEPKAQRTVTITNSGTEPLTISTIRLANNSDNRFTLITTDPPGAPVLPNGTFDIVVEYQPTVEAVADTAELRVISDAFPPVPTTVPLSGRGIDRHIDVSSLQVDFRDTYRNPEQPSQRTLTVTNNGEAPLRLTMLMTSGVGASAFSIQTAQPVDVAGQSSADLVVQFAPNAASAAFEATLTIVNDDDENPMVDVQLRGRGILPNVAFMPGNLPVSTAVGVPTRLSDVPVSSPQLFELINMDRADSFTISEFRIADLNGNPLQDNPFRVIDFEPETELDARDTLAVDIEFAPTKPGLFEARVEVYLDADPDVIAFVTITGEAIEVDIRGSGCSCEIASARASTGQSGALGSLLLIALAVLALRLGRSSRLGQWLRRRRAGAITLVLAVLCTAPLTARADVSRDIDITTFRPAPGVELGMLSVERPEVGSSGAWALNLALNYARNPLVARRVGPAMAESTGTVDRLVSGRTGSDLMFAYAFRQRFEAGLIVPFLQQSGDPPPGFSRIPSADGTALGDIALHGKAALLDRPEFALAGSATLTVPTATGDQFAGTKSPTLHPRAIVGIRIPRINIAINAGLRLRATSELADDIEQGTELTYGVAAEYRIQQQLSAMGELYGARGIGADEADAVSPLELAVGLRYRLTQQLAIAAGAGRGVLNGIGAPSFRTFVMASFSPRSRDIPPLVPPKPIDRGDSDSDGIINEYDKCPGEKEDIDSFADKDGCPDPDNDQDRVVDAEDKCPDQAEDNDGFEDEDGCPEADNDGDGIVDAEDKCPDQAED
ncbi:MAG: choice-of-anchor D domain-containing protein, partial [Proteobacteria bacterium]|nr:choice-of-anchor D domain-containing protein [Pseudomonadota bacterium]